MRAVIAEKYGGPEILQIADVPVPRVGPTGVLVRVYAASVNPVDWKLREGWLSPLWKLRFPVIWGCDVSGVVEQIGAAVTMFKPGDEVYGFKHGKVGKTYPWDLRRVRRPAGKHAGAKPATLTHQQAAAVPLAAVTAWQALVGQGRIKPGSKVLIQAGAGGVGAFAVQIAKAFGAYVAATAGTRNQDLLRELGADLAIDYTHERIEEKLSGYDVVLDCVGESLWPTSLSGAEVRRPAGYSRCPYSSRHLGKIQILLDGDGRHFLGHGACHTARQAFPHHPDQAAGRRFEKLNALIEAGKLRPVVEKIFSLEHMMQRPSLRAKADMSAESLW